MCHPLHQKEGNVCIAAFNIFSLLHHLHLCEYNLHTSFLKFTGDCLSCLVSPFENLKYFKLKTRSEVYRSKRVCKIVQLILIAQIAPYSPR